MLARTTLCLVPTVTLAIFASLTQATPVLKQEGSSDAFIKRAWPNAPLLEIIKRDGVTYTGSTERFKSTPNIKREESDMIGVGFRQFWKCHNGGHSCDKEIHTRSNGKRGDDPVHWPFLPPCTKLRKENCQPLKKIDVDASFGSTSRESEHDHQRFPFPPCTKDKKGCSSGIRIEKRAIEEPPNKTWNSKSDNVDKVVHFTRSEEHIDMLIPTCFEKGKLVPCEPPNKRDIVDLLLKPRDSKSNKASVELSARSTMDKIIDAPLEARSDHKRCHDKHCKENKKVAPMKKPSNVPTTKDILHPWTTKVLHPWNSGKPKKKASTEHYENQVLHPWGSGDAGTRSIVQENGVLVGRDSEVLKHVVEIRSEKATGVLHSYSAIKGKEDSSGVSNESRGAEGQFDLLERDRQVHDPYNKGKGGWNAVGSEIRSRSDEAKRSTNSLDSVISI